ncbi:MAG: insulinase family protein [Phycisphaerales bacterium]|nr:MAG: insulinase family protein [Phycisphaerales bacterium]
MTPHQRRQLLPVIMLCALIGPVCEVRADTDQGVQPGEFTLDNGLKLLLVERHEQPSFIGGLVFDVGSCNDPAGVSGIAHMFEHMLFKGSHVIGTTDYEAERRLIEQQDELRAKMNAEMNRMRLIKRRGGITDVLDPDEWTPEYKSMKEQYDTLLEAQRAYMKDNELSQIYSANGGAMLNAGTSEDMTIYFVQLPSNKLELFFWMESDRLLAPVMREFYVERENVREERRLRTESTPTGRFDEAFDALFWQSHPYGRPVLGWASEVESITRDDVREFFKVHYAPNNATLVMVGDFDSDKVIELAERYFGRVPRGETEPPPVITEEPKPIAERRFYAEAETNPRVRIRYHGVAIAHEDEAALDVLAELLSGKSGRLYKRLVTVEDAAIGRPGASNTSRKYAGFLQISATVKEGRTPEEVEQFVLDEIDKLREGEISDHELQKVKNQVLASSIRRLKSNPGLMFQLAIYDTWYHWSYINEAPKRMLEVTADDVRRVAATYLDPKTRTVAIYLTKEEAATEEDPELAAVLALQPPERHAQIKAMITQLKKTNDASKLQQQLQMMEPALTSGQMPEDRKPLLEYAVKVIRARVAELESANKESE